MPVADALVARKVPIAFATGYGASGVKERHAEWPIINKPYTASDIERAVRAALARVKS